MNNRSFPITNYKLQITNYKLQIPKSCSSNVDRITCVVSISIIPQSIMNHQLMFLILRENDIIIFWKELH
jgi:hypothetical protein